MSYVDESSDSRQRALAGGAVALMQVGLALAIVSGFAVTLMPPPPKRHLPVSQFPTKPVPPDKPQPQQTQPSVPHTTVVRPLDPIVPPPQDDRLVTPPLGPTAPTGSSDAGENPFVPPVQPSDPPARFAPKGAAARGDMARWVTTDDYPAADLRAGHMGMVRFRLAIDANGRVTGCSIVTSSGFEGLDAATCRNVMRRARFDPARDATGDTAPGAYEGTIRWVIPRD